LLKVGEEGLLRFHVGPHGFVFGLAGKDRDGLGIAAPEQCCSFTASPGLLVLTVQKNTTLEKSDHNENSGGIYKPDGEYCPVQKHVISSLIKNISLSTPNNIGCCADLMQKSQRDGSLRKPRVFLPIGCDIPHPRGKNERAENTV
jgi:hypothetical protein